MKEINWPEMQMIGDFPQTKYIISIHCSQHVVGYTLNGRRNHLRKKPL